MESSKHGTLLDVAWRVLALAWLIPVATSAQTSAEPLTNPAAPFVDWAATNFPRRYYRARGQ